MELKRVGVMSAGKVFGALGVFMGLLIGAFVALASVLGAAVQPPGGDNGAEMPAMFMGVGAIIFFPLLYGVFSFISGILYAWIYNLIAGVVGGIELDLEPRRP